MTIEEELLQLRLIEGLYNRAKKRGCPRGVMVKAMDCGIALTITPRGHPLFLQQSRLIEGLYNGAKKGGVLVV